MEQNTVIKKELKRRYINGLRLKIYIIQGCCFTWKPGKTQKYLECGNLGIKKLEFEKF